MKEIYCNVRDSAYEIIKKGATYYGIGMAAAKIAEALVRDSHTVAPVSVHLNGEYGLQDLCLSTPTVLGKNGAEQILEINFNEEEKRKLWHSAEELKKNISPDLKKLPLVGLTRRESESRKLLLDCLKFTAGTWKYEP